ncbi:hypothetical protein TNIN_473821 [Trichonephila inaurata madagascariensis]|uniref:Uncharacterized protein n=1 Tax=Trichonephila inaurata madagascariensis TaxID=2747483 RepID=A0A8X6XQQ1_9ARAC|nr:hypothetical protein TNIN_473821 [Trichonephila inaurata madagascariensis]
MSLKQYLSIGLQKCSQEPSTHKPDFDPRTKLSSTMTLIQAVKEGVPLEATKVKEQLEETMKSEKALVGVSLVLPPSRLKPYP